MAKFNYVWNYLGKTLKQLGEAITPYLSSVDAEKNLIVANSSTYTVTVGPGGSHLIPDFSGMLIVNDHYDGGVELWIAGGGDTIAVAATNTGGGPAGSILQISGTGYEWINDSNMQGPFTFTIIKTRNEA